MPLGGVTLSAPGTLGLATVPRSPSALAAPGWYVTEESHVLTGDTTLTACREETKKDFAAHGYCPYPDGPELHTCLYYLTLVLVEKKNKQLLEKLKCCVLFFLYSYSLSSKHSLRA